MVDENPYQIPEVDQSKWFGGGHLGAQTQQINQQARPHGLTLAASAAQRLLSLACHKRLVWCNIAHMLHIYCIRRNHCQPAKLAWLAVLGSLFVLGVVLTVNA